MFFIAFLDLRQRIPFLFYILAGCASYFICATVLSVIAQYRLPAMMVTYGLLAACFIFFVAAAYSWFKGNQAALMLLLAWGVYLLTTVLYALGLVNVLPQFLINFDLLKIGSCLSMLLMSLALAGRINRLREQQRRLKNKLLDESMSSDRLKNEFLATISHELRTPINGIKGCIDLIADDSNDVDRLEMAKQSTANLERLIDRLLLFSDAVAGRLKKENVSFHVKRNVIALVKEYRVLFPKVDIKLDIDFSSSLSFNIDGKKLIMIIQQLLDNACRFSGGGWVELSISIEQDKQLVIDIRDNGNGIPEKDVEKITEAFSQRDQSFSRRHGGMGVGLALTTALTRVLEGKCAIDSTWGHGTDIHLTIPVVVEGQTIEEPVADTLSRSLHVLVVEDNPVNQTVLASILKKFNCEVSCAENGEVALELFESTAFDLVFMDCQMPIMDGLEASREIRLREQGISHTPIIAVTANAMSGDREKCIEAGMDDYIAKPVKREQLKDALLRYAG